MDGSKQRVAVNTPSADGAREVPGVLNLIADKWRVDRSTVVGVCKTAKQGALDALAMARPGRLGKTATELTLEERWPTTAGCVTRWRSRPSSCIWSEERALGLTGPVPMRVDGDVKAGLLALVEQAVGAGWSLRRTCRVLEVSHTRVLGWDERVASGIGLDDRKPGPDQALQALLDWERDEIIAVYDDWHTVRPVVSQAGAPRVPRATGA